MNKIPVKVQVAQKEITVTDRTTIWFRIPFTAYFIVRRTVAFNDKAKKLFYLARKEFDSKSTPPYKYIIV